MIFVFFTFFPRLKANNNIGNEGIKFLCDLLIDKSKNMVRLKLNTNNISEIGCKRLAQSIEKKRFELFDIANNKVDFQGAKSIFESFIKSQSNSIDLNIGWNKLTSEIADFIVNLLNSGKLAKLNIEKCELKTEGIIKFSKINEKLPLIKSLNISGNKICDEGLMKISHILHLIPKLYLETNNITEIGLKTLFEKDLSKLTLLNLYGNPISAKAGLELGKLKGGIRKIILEKCELGDEGLKAFLQGINENSISTIQFLNLSIFRTREYIKIDRNLISDEGIKIIANSLEKFESGLKLHLSIFL